MAAPVSLCPEAAPRAPSRSLAPTLSPCAWSPCSAELPGPSGCLFRWPLLPPVPTVTAFSSVPVRWPQVASHPSTVALPVPRALSCQGQWPVSRPCLAWAVPARLACLPSCLSSARGLLMSQLPPGLQPPGLSPASPPRVPARPACISRPLSSSCWHPAPSPRSTSLAFPGAALRVVPAGASLGHRLQPFP